MQFIMAEKLKNLMNIFSIEKKLKFQNPNDTVFL